MNDVPFVNFPHKSQSANFFLTMKSGQSAQVSVHGADVASEALPTARGKRPYDLPGPRIIFHSCVIALIASRSDSKRRMAFAPCLRVGLARSRQDSS